MASPSLQVTEDNNIGVEQLIIAVCYTNTIARADHSTRLRETTNERT